MPDSPPTRALIEARALQRECTLSAIVKTRPLNMQTHMCQGIIARKKTPATANRKRNQRP